MYTLYYVYISSNYKYCQYAIATAVHETLSFVICQNYNRLINVCLNMIDIITMISNETQGYLTNRK